MILTQIERGEVLQSQLLASVPNVSHFCTARTCVDPTDGVWLPRQVHSAEVVMLDRADMAVTEADAVITCLPEQWIGVRTADCVPVLLADPVCHAVAAVHAGWRGTAAHIVALTVQRMVSDLGCRPSDIFAAVGPSIGPDAFEVGEEVAMAFVAANRGDCVLRESWGPSGRQPFAKAHIDLWQSNVMDLLDEGLLLEHIDCTPWCTFTNVDRFFSARREGIGTGRIVSAIRIDC